MSERRRYIHWSCSDYTPCHQHRWYWSAWLCGRAQRAWRWLWLACAPPGADVRTVTSRIYPRDDCAGWRG